VPAINFIDTKVIVDCQIPGLHFNGSCIRDHGYKDVIAGATEQNNVLIIAKVL
jgi:hypothetical protein